MSRHSLIRSRAAITSARLEPLERRALMTTITVNGTAGDDVISLSYDASNYVVNLNGQESLHPSGGVTNVVINALGGADQVNVLGTLPLDAVAVNGGSGDDRCSLGSGNMDPIDGNVYFDGEAGNDSLVLNDDGAPGLPHYRVNAANVQGTRFADINYAATEHITLNASDGGSVIFVHSTGPGVVVQLNTEGATDDFEIASTGTGSKVVLSSSTATGQPDILAVTGAAAVELARSQNFSRFHVAAASSRVKLQPGRNKVLKIDANETNQSHVDLTDNAMVFNYTGAPGPDLHASYLNMSAAYANGAWTGPGITSSSAAADPALAIGLAEATELFSALPVNYMGVSVDSTAVILKTALNGDANLDGTVNLQDFNRLASNFGRQALWTQGNFNYDSRATLEDFNLLAGQFGRTFAPTSASAPAGPEAAGGSLIRDLLA